MQDLPRGRYRKVVLAEHRVFGAIAVGDVADHEPLADAVRQGRDVRHALDQLRAGDWTELGLAPAPAPRRGRRAA